MACDATCKWIVYDIDTSRLTIDPPTVGNCPKRPKTDEALREIYDAIKGTFPNFPRGVAKTCAAGCHCAPKAFKPKKDDWSKWERYDLNVTIIVGKQKNTSPAKDCTYRVHGTYLLSSVDIPGECKDGPAGHIDWEPLTNPNPKPEPKGGESE
jgi:hypothetical protein